MTAPDTAAIRAQMEALAGFTPGPWGWAEENCQHGGEWYLRPGVMLADGSDGTPGGDIIDQANARLIAAAPDMHDTIIALCGEIDDLRVAINRQAGAAKTLRECTLAEVQHLKNMDRSEYHAAATVDSERQANAMLTEEVERLRSENERLRRGMKANLADHINGTPCASIRWQHEREELVAEIARLREAFEPIEEAGLGGFLSPGLVAEITTAALAQSDGGNW